MRRRSLRALLACVSTLGALLACGGPGYPGFTPFPTPPMIHAPGLQPLTGLSSLHAANMVTSAPFQQQDGPWRILLNEPVDGLFIANLDGTGLRQVARNQDCTRQASVTRDGMWAICAATSTTTNAHTLEVVSLNPTGAPQHTELPLDPDVLHSPLAISPDGAYFAALNNLPDKSCAIAIYGLTSGYTQATLLTTLASDVFELPQDVRGVSDPTPPTPQPECRVMQIGWSSDGARLLVAPFVRGALLPKGVNPRTMIMVNMSAPVAALIRSGTRVASIPATSFVAIPGSRILADTQFYGGFPLFAWNPVTAALAFAQGGALGGKDPGMVMEYQPGDQQASALFTMPYGGYPIVSLNWSSDGSRLLVGIGGPLCGDCGVGVQTWYLYTSPAAWRSSPAISFMGEGWPGVARAPARCRR